MKHKAHHSRKHRKAISRRTAPGASPGTVVVDPAAKPARIQIMSYGPEEFEECQGTSLEEVQHLIRKHTVTWINLDGLGDATLIEKMGARFGLHRLALEDVVNVHQRAKVEQYDDHLFFVSPMSSVAKHHGFTAEQLSLFLMRGLVITFQEGLDGDPFGPVRTRIRTCAGKIRSREADYLAYALIDALIDGYFPVLEKYGERLDTLEDTLFSDQRAQILIDDLHNIRSDLRHLRRAIWPQREAMSALLRETAIFINDETRVYLRDCYDHVVQLIDLLETYREMTADMRDLYMSSVSNRINETMQVLTIISTIFIPLTFIAGVYGMNFEFMPELHMPWGYPFALLLMAICALVLVYIFYHMGWIRFKRREETHSV